MNTEPLYQGVLMTADEYFKMPDDGFRYELIHGVLVMTPSPTFLHQRALSDLFSVLHDHTNRNDLGVVVVAPLDAKLGDLIVYQPDILFFNKAKALAREDRVDVVPDLVVEILSPGTALKDLNVKRADYEAAGIQEYWVADTEARSFRFFVLKEGRYVEQAPDVFESHVLKGLRFDGKGFWESLGK